MKKIILILLISINSLPVFGQTDPEKIKIIYDLNTGERTLLHIDSPYVPPAPEGLFLPYDKIAEYYPHLTQRISAAYLSVIGKNKSFRLHQEMWTLL
ncbi:MAG: hypothetical protein ACRBF0_13515 [Calditrichia bacterium]